MAKDKKPTVSAPPKPATPAPTPSRAPASDVMGAPLRNNTDGLRNNPADRERYAAERNLAEYAGPAFYDQAKLNAVRVQRGGQPVAPPVEQTTVPAKWGPAGGGEAKSTAEQQRRYFGPRMPGAAPTPDPKLINRGNPINPALLGGGSGVGPAADTEQLQAMLRENLQAPAPALKAQASVQGAQPWRESDGPRVFSAAPAPTQPSPQQAAANQLLSRVSTTGYSPGVLATRERQRAQQELAALNLSPAAHSAALARIQQGDTGVVSRAAQMMAQIPPSAMNRGPVAQYVAEQLRSGDGAQQFDAARQADLSRYRQVAQRNTDIARTNSFQAQSLGLDPLTPVQQLQNALRANLGQVDSATIRKMIAEDPANGALRGALVQATERERKHAENEARKQAKLDEQARGRKADDERLKFERDWMLKGLDVQGKAGGRGQVDAATEKQMMDAWRDHLRDAGDSALSWPDFQRQYVNGYSPGPFGRVEEMGYNALAGLADVAGAPLRAMGTAGPGRMPPGDSRYPQGLRQPPPGPQAAPIPPQLVAPPQGVQPVAWNRALSHLADLTPEQRAAFDQKTPQEQQALLAASIGM